MNTDLNKSLLNCHDIQCLNKWFNDNKGIIYANEFSSINSAILHILNVQMEKTKYFYSQTDLAKEIGVATSTINRFYNGSRHPNKYIWYRIGLLGNFDSNGLNHFMAQAGYSLLPSNKTDAIMIYCHNNKLHISEIYNMMYYYSVSEIVLKELFPNIA